MTNNNQEWQTVSSQEIHRNPWYRLKEDLTIMPSGQQGKYTYVDRLPAVVIAALTPENEIYLVGQYRYPIKRFSWEIPMGAIEKETDDLLAAAKRELLEEVGLEAEKWTKLGTYYFAPGMSNQIAHLFLAEDLIQKQAMPDFTEFLTSQKMPIREFERLIIDNEIIDSNSIAIFYKLKQVLAFRKKQK